MNGNPRKIDGNPKYLRTFSETSVTYLDSGLDVDGSDLLDDLGGGVEVDHTLVDPQLELVPGLGSLTARGLTGGDPQGLGGHPNGALHLHNQGV